MTPDDDDPRTAHAVHFALVGYLVSAQASWITGQTIPLNGGYSMSL